MKNFFLFAFCLVTLHSVTSGQRTPEQAAMQAREQFSDIKKRSIELERMKRNAAKRSESSSLPPKFPEIKEDFEQIQKINNHLQELAAFKTPLNHSATLKLASEINQRALRLKANLFPLENKQKIEKENKKPLAAEPRDVRQLLTILDGSINSFVNSSIFQNLNLANSEDSLKAQKDLETVISISNAIKLKTKNQ